MNKYLHIRSLGYETVYLPLSQVANTPYHIRGDELSCYLQISALSDHQQPEKNINTVD